MEQGEGATGQQTHIQSVHRQSIRLDNAAALPEGTWVSRRDGRLYRSSQRGSLVEVRGKDLEEFELISSDPFEPDENVRVGATRANIRPNF